MKIYGKSVLLTAAILAVFFLWFETRVGRPATGATPPEEDDEATVLTRMQQTLGNTPWEGLTNPVEGLVEIATGDQVVEVEDPASAAFQEKLKALDRMPPMRGIDTAAQRLARAYDEAKGAPMPYMQDNGRINFYFGTLNPRIVCRPLRLTNIELEPGEIVRNVHISDSARWLVSGAASGTDDLLTTHIIIKPQLPEIAANMLVHTDRRTYSLELISVLEGQYMPSVGFVYPEVPAGTKAADAESWSMLLSMYQQADIVKNAAAVQEIARETALGARGTDPEAVYTRYTIRVIKGGNIPWKPASVYDAAGHTYIVMPNLMQVTESPAFFIKADGREKLTNYRVEGNLYIVDRLFDIGILQVGGDRVAIYRDVKVADSASQR